MKHSHDLLKIRNEIKSKFNNLKKHHKYFDELLYKLNGKNDIFIFGGWLRDLCHSIINKKKWSWRDIDLVVDGEILENNLPVTLKSRFGGYRYNLSNKKKVDFWQLNETYALKKGIIEGKTANSLINTTVFSINAIAYNIKSNEIIFDKALEHISNKIIYFNCDKYLWDYPVLQSYRAWDISNRLGYNLDPKVLNFISQVTKETQKEQFFKAVLEHKNWVSKKEIDLIYSSFLDS